MRHLCKAIILAALVLSSCSSLPEQNAKLRDDVCALRATLLQSYRDSFETYEYPKLHAFAKQGYDWHWSESMIESSGFITKRERERIQREHGKASLDLWDQGWHAAYGMMKQAYWTEIDEMKSPTTKSTLSTEGAPSVEK